MGIIRLLLAISVVIEHTGGYLAGYLTGGKIAVETFFIISGFYMTLILNEKYINENNSYFLFISNRILRLVPIYWTILIITFLASIVGLILFPNFKSPVYYFNEYFYKDNYLPLYGFFFLLISNIFIIFQDLVMFFGLDINNRELFFTANFNLTDPKLFKFLFIPQSWSVALEIYFYIICPFLVKRNYSIIIILILLSLIIKIAFIKYGITNDPWSYRFFPSELMFFLLGAISYKTYKHLTSKIANNFAIILLAVVLIICTFYQHIQINNSLKELIFFTIMTFSIPVIFKQFKNYKWDYLIGDLSYPIYLSHVFIIGLLSIPNLLIVKNNLGIFTIIASIIFSISLNKLITNKIESFRQKRLLA